MANIKDTFIDLVIRGKDLFSSEASKTEKALQSLRAETGKTRSELRQYQQAEKEIGKAQQLQATLAEQKEAMSQAADAISAYAATIDQSTKPTQQQKVELARLNREAIVTEKAYRKTAQELGNQLVKLQEAGVNTKKLGDEQKRLSQTSKELSDKLEKARRSAEEYASQSKIDNALIKEVRSAEKAVDAFEQYAKQLERMGEPTEAQVADITRLARKASEAERAYRMAADELGHYILEMDAAGKETGDLVVQQQKLAKKAKELSQRLEQAQQKTKKLTSGLKVAAETAEAAGRKFNGLTTTLLGLAGTYIGIDALSRGMEKFFRTAGQMEDFRYQLIGVYDDIEKGSASFDWIVDFTKTVPNTLEDVTQAFIMLHNQGMDPTDGSLKKIIAANAKYGKGVETLIPIIRQLTQSWAKNRIQAEEVAVLIENGIPVWNMLSETTGKSVGQLQKMAEQGRLTRTELKQLIDVMGDKSMAAMEQRMQSFNAQLAKMSDRINQILDTVARSGSLEYFKQQLDELGDAIDKMAESGELQAMAQQVSTAMVDTAKAIKDVVAFCYEWAGALKVVLAGMLAIKAADYLSHHKKKLISVIDLTRNYAKANGGVLAMLGKVRLGMLAFGAAVTFTGVQFARLASAIWQVYDAHKGLDESQALQADTQRRVNERLAEHSEKLGITIGSMEEFNRLLEEGTIVLDKQERELVTAEEWQRRLAKRMQETAKAAAEQLTPSVQKIINELASMKDRGDSVEKMFKTLFASKNPASIGDMLDLAVALDNVRARGELTAKELEKGLIPGLDDVAKTGQLTAQEIEKGLIAALSQLTGEELKQFQSTATLAFKAVDDAQQRTSEMMSTVLSAAMNKVGLDAQVISNAFTDMGKDVVNTLELLAFNSEATNQHINAVADAAIGLGKTEADLALLRETIIDLGLVGKLTGEQVSAALQKIENRMGQLTREASEVEQAISRLNVVSLSQLQDELRQTEADYKTLAAAQKRGEATTYQVRQAYLAWAESAVKVAQASDSTIDPMVAMRAAAQGLNDELQEMIGSFAGAAGNSQQFEQSLDSLSTQASGAKRIFDTLNNAAGQGSGKMKQMSEAAGEADKSLADLAAGADISGNMVGALQGHVDAIRDELKGLSEATYQYYLQLRGLPFKGAAAGADDYAAQLAEVNREIARLNATIPRSDIGDWLVETALAAEQAKKEYLEQAQYLEHLMEQLRNTEELTESLVKKAEQAAGGFDLLDKSSLSGLESAVESARQALVRMTESAQSTLESLQLELAGLNGDIVEQERLRLQQKRLELEAKLAEAKAAGNEEAVAELNQALRLFDQIENKRMQQAHTQVWEKQQQEQERLEDESRARQEEQQARQEQARQDAEARRQKQQKNQQAQAQRQQAREHDAAADEAAPEAVAESVAEAVTDAATKAAEAATEAPTPAELPTPPATPQTAQDAATADMKVVEVVQFDINIAGRPATTYTTPQGKDDLFAALHNLKRTTL